MGSHSQWAGTRERDVVAAVSTVGGGGEEWERGALGEKSGREEQDVAVNEGERRGHMKQNNYQHVM